MKFVEVIRLHSWVSISYLFISSPLHVSLIVHYSIVVLFQDVLLFYVHIVSSVSSACGPNEEFKACGPSPSCEPTCAKPRVNCPEVSITYIHFSWSWKLSCLRYSQLNCNALLVYSHQECVRGCHCVKGHVRNAAKQCVPVSKCKRHWLDWMNG